MIKKRDALVSLVPQAQWVLRGDVVEWLSPDINQPTEAEIQAEILRLEADQPWKELRKQRNLLIAETDYLALSDATLTDDMKTYRQTLRDLPANTTDPANPVWPTKPGA
jgi:hypothetical protein